MRRRMSGGSRALPWQPCPLSNANVLPPMPGHHSSSAGGSSSGRGISSESVTKKQHNSKTCANTHMHATSLLPLPACRHRQPAASAPSTHPSQTCRSSVPRGQSPRPCSCPASSLSSRAGSPCPAPAAGAQHPHGCLVSRKLGALCASHVPACWQSALPGAVAAAQQR